MKNKMIKKRGIYSVLNLRSKFSTGFTLVELLVAIVIITILAGISLASMSVHRQKTRDARRVLELSQLKDAINLHFQEKGTFPCSIYPERYSDPGNDTSHPCYGTDQYFIYKIFGGQMPFTSSLNVLPMDPLFNDFYHYTKSSTNPGDPKRYCLATFVEYIDPTLPCSSGFVYGSYVVEGP